jgi:hypothetical protein
LMMAVLVCRNFFKPLKKCKRFWRNQNLPQIFDLRRSKISRFLITRKNFWTP